MAYVWPPDRETVMQAMLALDPVLRPALMMWEHDEHAERGVPVRKWYVWFRHAGDIHAGRGRERKPRPTAGAGRNNYSLGGSPLC